MLVKPQTDLVLLCGRNVVWSLGATHHAQVDLTEITGFVHGWLKSTPAEALLFWDSALGQPDEDQVCKIFGESADLYHAGLSLGLAGIPRALDYTHPTWMFNCDPSPDIEATSWRVSLRACLVRTDVLRRMGFLRPEFSTVEAATLEWGHRLLTRGVFMRHVPYIVGEGGTEPLSPVRLPFEDELRFIYYRFGEKWAAWTIFRALMTRYTTVPIALRSWREVISTSRLPEPDPYRAPFVEDGRSKIGDSNPSNSHLPSPGYEAKRVSVLIPTVDRYPYLRSLLDQLRRQTVPPCEIIVVDQTAREQCDVSLAKDFSDLPLNVISQDEAGQCSSRNSGLQIMGGDHVLFIDDDDDVNPDLIARHLCTLAQFGADSSSGIADEVGAEHFKQAPGMVRSSDVFPTNNTLAKRSALEKSGLFDLAYNRGQRADGDLGMRLYLSGACMVLNTDISVLHHHAPTGGLRKHKARAVTYASSRKRLMHRNLPTATEVYLAKRYFAERQLNEMLWLRLLGTFSVRGNVLKKTAKIIVGIVLLPHSLWAIRRSKHDGNRMFLRYPIIGRIQERVRV